jgi:hypothetical protein
LSSSINFVISEEEVVESDGLGYNPDQYKFSGNPFPYWLTLSNRFWLPTGPPLEGGSGHFEGLDIIHLILAL